MKNRLNITKKALILLLFIGGATCGAMDLNIAWDPTTTAEDGTPLNNISGYKLFCGEAPGNYTIVIDVPGETSAQVTGLEYNKTYYFSVKAVTDQTESTFSEELTWVAPVMPDTDVDQISDAWELKHFEALHAVSKTTDSDGDGSSDWNEFITGTNPNDSSDYKTLSIADGKIISFKAVPAVGDGYENRSRSYTLMHCEDLASGTWVPVQGLENIMAENQLVNLDITDRPSGFYRTQIHLN